MTKVRYEDEDLGCMGGFKHMLFGTKPRPKRLVPGSVSEKPMPTIPSQSRSAPPRPQRRRSTRPMSTLQASTIVEADPTYDQDEEIADAVRQGSEAHSMRQGSMSLRQSSEQASLRKDLDTISPSLARSGSIGSVQRERIKRTPGRKYSTTLDKWVQRSDPNTQGNPNVHEKPYLEYRDPQVQKKHAQESHSQSRSRAPAQSQQPQSGSRSQSPIKSQTHSQSRTQGLQSYSLSQPQSYSQSRAQQSQPRYQGHHEPVRAPKEGRRTSTFPFGGMQIDTALSQEQGAKYDDLVVDSPMGMMAPGPGTAGA